MIKIFKDTSNLDEVFGLDRKNQVNCYQVFWYDSYNLFVDCNRRYHKEFSIKKEAISFAKKAREKNFPTPFIIQKTVDRSYFRKDVQVEWVKE